jgi:hypothetical protein
LTIWVCKMSDEQNKGPCILKLQANARTAPNGTCLPPIISLSSSTLSDVLRPTLKSRCDRSRSVLSEDFRRPSPGFCIFSSAMLVSSDHTGRCQRVVDTEEQQAPKRFLWFPAVLVEQSQKHSARNCGMPGDLMHLAECPS